ncbi:hypothetical protein B0H16DRAFT_1456137 [Mycena metata]|uniref:Uncharacterized protein n=1 Tax=Mycena metata TaxID=1033252 RepID=A0AAD7JFH7_9AGAR|nr:hypothetical protein B0H16DRAFT_1456137 [Mycena metata]
MNGTECEVMEEDPLHHYVPAKQSKDIDPLLAQSVSCQNMEEVEEIEITEGAVGGIEINDGGADTNNTIEITDGGAHAENVMEGEMEEEEGGKESISTSVISSTLSESKRGACGLGFCSCLMLHAWGWLHPRCCWVKERRAWAGRDYLTLDSAIGSSAIGSGSDSGYGLETGPAVTPALGAHGISTLARRRVLRVWWQLGLHGELPSTAAWTPQSWCASLWVYLATHRGEKGRAMGKESGSGADEVVGVREATEDRRDVFIQIVLKVRLAREGMSARAPASLRACKTPAWVPESPPRVGCFGVEIAIVVGVASTGHIARGYRREAGKQVCIVLRRGHGDEDKEQ